ncbi:MAG: hypothetical protein R6X25_06890 [Candidatus Krumholzibacteriia bacterium]
MVALLVIALPVAAAAQSTISELTVIAGGSSGIQPPPGFTKINTDLNLNAGGDYVYLCYKKGVGAPITGVTVLWGHDADPGAGWHRVNVDLNRGAGGEYLWLCYTKDPGCSVLKNVAIVVGADTPPPAGYYKIPLDLNLDAGGAYIYLAYQMQ